MSLAAATAMLASPTKEVRVGADDRAGRFFAAALEASIRTEQRVGGAIVHDYRIGRFRIRILFAGPGLLEPLGRALTHLRVPEEGAADLVVHAWDSATTGARLPPPAWPKEAQRACGEIDGLIDERYYTHFDGGVKILSLLDRERGVAVLWARDPAAIPYWERSAPLRSILHPWMSQHGLHWVHGGAVGLTDSGALLVGLSGAGKSSTALACLNSSLSYAGDDHCLVGFDPSPVVYSLYSSAKLHPHDFVTFPWLRPLVSNPGVIEGGKMMGKALCFAHEGFPERMTSGFPLKAMLLPRVSGRRDTEVRPAPGMDGLRVIAPEIAMKWPSQARTALATLGRLFRTVPSYYLDVGTDRDQIPAVIRDVLQSA